jgi:hypothetical protein
MNGHHAELLCVCSDVSAVELVLQTSWYTTCTHWPVHSVYKSTVLQISQAYSRQCIHEASASCAEERVSVDVQLFGNSCHSLYTDVTIHRMYKCMSLKVTKLCETFPTLVTDMWMFCCVCLVVHQKSEIVTNTFVAHLTDIQAITGSTVRSISENWFEVWAGKRRG